MKYILKIINKQRLETCLRRFKSTIELLPISETSSGGSLALFSLSRNIYTNLAFENAIAESINSKPDLNVLLMWISEPCIVYGRHQNPWLECDVKRSGEEGVEVVRRYSGGGCVYHDIGNLNISFLTNRLKFDRKTNLSIIKEGLEETNMFENVQLEISTRHDIYARDLVTNESFKISGSAARLSQKFSYHHCTLLYNAKIEQMSLLKSTIGKQIHTKATPSVRAKCRNMKSFSRAPNSEDDMSLQRVVESICKSFWMRYQQNWCIDHLFKYVQPEELDDLEKSINELRSWEHKFGATPKFQLSIEIDHDLTVSLKIENGIISDFELTKNLDNDQFRTFLKSFIGCRINPTDIKNVFSKTDLSNNVNNIYFVKFVEFFNKYLN